MFTPSARVRSRPVGDRVMLLDPDAQELLTLNPTGSAVWQSLEGGGTLDDAVDALQQRWPAVDPGELRDDVARLVAELVEIGALVEG